MRLSIIFWILLFLPPLVPREGYSLPEFAVLYGSEMYDDHDHGEVKTMDCRACHVNPSGGGMRNEHGRQFSVEKLPMIELRPEFKEAADGARINRFFSVGADLRFAYIRTQGVSAFQDTFFTMQADIYIAFAPTEHLTVFYMDGQLQNREVFGLIHGLSQNSHIKFGRFIPAYGLKLDDHTAFIREKLGFSASDGKTPESGVEVGFANERLFGNVALFNGSGPAPDENQSKAVSGTAGLKTPQFWLGGSYYHNRIGKDDATALTKDYAGAHAAVRLWKVAILGEWDWIAAKTSTTASDGYVAYSELFAILTQGIIGKVKYEDYDPDRDAAGDRLRRFTVGANLYPYPFTELIIEYRKNKEESEIKNDQFLAMAHLFF
jgi:hypothetical protein